MNDQNKNEPLASVVMCAYNEEIYIAESIESILNQSLVRIELIIIDDASEDKTVAVISKFNDTRIRLIRNDRNLGIAASWNRGIAAAQSPIIVIADADDISIADRLKEQINFLDLNPNVGAVGAYIHVIDAEGERIGTIKTPTDDGRIKAGMMAKSTLLHCTLAMRKAMFLAVGGYREKFTASQDYDMLLRLSEKTQLASIPHPLCCYRLNPKSMSTRNRTAQRHCIELARRFADERRRTGTDTYLDLKEDHLVGKADPQTHGARIGRYHLQAGKLAGAAGKLGVARRHYISSILNMPAQLDAYLLLLVMMTGTRGYLSIQRRFGTTSIEPQ